MYKIQLTDNFEKQISRFTKKNKPLEDKIEKALLLISEDPKTPKLRTHKSDTKKYGKCFSSRVSGDLRIIWDYGNEELTIIALDFGGHSGRNKVYK